MKYIRQWFSDFAGIFVHELKQIFSDGGVLIIFLVGGLGYPIVYSIVYSGDVLNDTPVAVVDMADCAESRRYIREVDATRELNVASRCMSMAEARQLLAQRKVNGILYFPEDFGRRMARGETATLSVYADMSSFLYYRNILMGTEFVMLHELKGVQIERYREAGMTEAQAAVASSPIRYEENNPYNRTFAYNIFFLSAALMLVIQQTMFYGMSLLAGTMREQNRSFALLPSSLHGRGMGRVVWGRGMAYGLVYLIVGMYVAFLVPSIPGLPQRGSYWDILTLLLFFIVACVFFCMTWSTFITRRESVFLLLLWVSPVALFLTGCSWPVTAFPPFWRWVSYLFPSTFACQGFVNLNTAGATLNMIRPQIIGLTLQSVVYCVLAHAAIYVENILTGKFHQAR